MQKIKFLRRIVCVLFLNLLCFGPLSLPISAQELNGAKVTLSMRDATIEDFANEVAKQTGLNVKFADEGVKALKRGLDSEGALPGPLNLARKAPNYYIKARATLLPPASPSTWSKSSRAKVLKRL